MKNIMKSVKKIIEKPMILSMLLLIIASVILSGCTGPKKITTSDGGKVEVSEDGTGPDWCKAGMKITSSSPQGQGTFTIKGITTYSGKEVCQAEWNLSQGVMTEYFSKDSSYMHLIMRDNSGNIIQETDLNNPNPQK